jgi:hypothetical protein
LNFNKKKSILSYKMVYFTLGYRYPNGSTTNVDIELISSGDAKWATTTLRQHINENLPVGYVSRGVAMCGGKMLRPELSLKDNGEENAPYPGANDPTFILIPVRPQGAAQAGSGRKKRKSRRTKRKGSKRKGSKRRRRGSRTRRH